MTVIIRSRYADFSDHRDVAIFVEPDHGRRGLVSPFVIREIVEGELIEPTIARNSVMTGEEFLQAVMNHGWEIGLRPTGFHDTTNQVAAIKEHLHDLRALVFEGQVKPKGAA